MQFDPLSTTPLKLSPQFQWLWYSDQSSSFVVGDDRAAFAVSVSNPLEPSQLVAENPYDSTIPPRHPCNLPIPRLIYDEIAKEPWHGFQFLERSAYDHAVDSKGDAVGDFLRTLVFGPDYGHYLLHPLSGLVLSLRGGSMELLKRTGKGFTSIDKTKPRGKAALAFAGHPDQPLIAYGDNAGTFHAHAFGETGFGKASKIAAKERKASRLEFVKAGKLLAVGGMGYLAAYSFNNGKFTPAHEISISVRDFIWLADNDVVLVNQGIHGVAAYNYDAGGFAKIGDLQPTGAVQHMAVSKCQKFLAVAIQETAGVSIYKLKP